MTGSNKIKSLMYWPLGLGALVFAALGISNIIQAAADQGASCENSSDIQSIRSLQPEGLNCDLQYCAACGGCSKGQFNQAVEKDVNSTVNLTGRDSSY
jgi:hypothetical protein